MPTIRGALMKINAYFELLHPHSVDLSFENVTKFVNTPFVLKTKKEKMARTWGTKPMLILRGERSCFGFPYILSFLTITTAV